MKELTVKSIIDLIYKIYRLKENQEKLLSSIPFLINVANYYCRRKYLTREQEFAIWQIKERYRIIKKLY